MQCCRIVNGIKNIKKQPWSNVECFAFGPKDKNRSPFHGEKTQMTK